MKHRHSLLLLVTFLLVILFLTGCSIDTSRIQELISDRWTSLWSDSEIKPHNLASAPSDAPFSVTFLDVGQADASVIQCDGHYMLIDGGNKDDSSLLYRYLADHGISNLDLVIGTHPDEDHIGGLTGAFHYSSSGLTLCSADQYNSDAFQDFKKYALLKSQTFQIPSVGDTYTLGDAMIEILAVNSGESSNDTSIVTKITYGDISVLFMGDAQYDTEQFLMDSAVSLDTTILKVGHHGSADSTSSDFLSCTKPEFSIISAGKNNPYGHPDADVLERLKDVDSTILRTDLHGDILFTSDGTHLACYTQYSAESPSLSFGPEADGDRSCTYILNLRSKKFHNPSCDSINTMSAKNRLDFFGTRDEALKLEYEPCGSCKP